MAICIHTTLFITTVLFPRKPPLPPGGSISRGTSKEVWAALTSEEGVEHIRHFRPIGKVKAQNPDGTLQLELQKPPHGPYGFYVARGVDKYKHGESELTNYIMILY